MQIVVAVVLLCVCGALGGLPTKIKTVTIPTDNASGKFARPLLHDMNGDGLSDIVTNTISGGVVTVAWYETKPGYNFEKHVIDSYSGEIFYHLGVADFDNDGDLDIFYVRTILTNPTTFIPVFVENAAGTWTPRIISGYGEHDLTDFGVWDFNNDGKADVMMRPFDPQNTFMFVNNGGWSFTQTNFTKIKPVYTYGDMWSVKWNGANVLVSTAWSSEVGFATYNSGTGMAFTTVGGVYNGVSSFVADFNMDGKFDIIAGGNNCWNTAIFLNGGGSSWTTANVPNPTGECFANSRVSAGDIDGGNSAPEIIISASQSQYLMTVKADGSIDTTTFLTSTSVVPQHNVGPLYSTGFKNSDVIMQDSTGFSVWTTCAVCGSCTSGSYVNSTGSCVRCAAGYSSSGYGQTTCFPCPAGTFSASGGVCTPCPAGSYSTTVGATSCTQCTASKASPGGPIPCASCPANHQPVNSTSCYPCSAGYYSTAGSSTCLACGAGSFRGGDMPCCTNCPPGTYAGAGASICQPCPYGYVSNGSTATCTACAAGFYSAAVAGSDTCVACPAGTTSSAGAAYCT